MAESFGVKMGVEGEKEFKNALKEINSAFKVLGSEMNLVTSQFDKNDKSIQSLSARNGVLTKKIEAQKNKVQTLQAALDMLYDASGTLIHDVIEPEPMGVVLKNNDAYFIGTVIDSPLPFRRQGRGCP